jgi:hypothetical protein
LHPHARDRLELDKPQPERPSLYRPPRRKKDLAQWMVEVRCRCLGHVWRQSYSLQGYETCARCHLHRLPLH